MFSLLNPHVYIDTIIILGGIGAKLASAQQLPFWFGCSSASFLWFFSISILASFTAPFFQNEKALRVLDILIGLVMLFIAINLLLFFKPGI
jgi:L-lysine exporter family protein LysE/ArgO